MPVDQPYQLSMMADEQQQEHLVTTDDAALQDMASDPAQDVTENDEDDHPFDTSKAALFAEKLDIPSQLVNKATESLDLS